MMNTERNKAAEFLRERDKLEILKDGTLAHEIAVGAIEDALAAAPSPVAQDERQQFEALDIDNHRLRRTMQKLMGRLATLLDEDHFAECEGIVRSAGVQHPVAQDDQESPDFGDYVTIEQKRFGVKNEFYRHKVIGRFSSNTWIDVPAQTHIGAVQHDTIEDVVRVICCGIVEDKVEVYRVADARLCKARAATPAQDKQDTAGKDDELHFNATRLRNVARLVGLESAIPEDDATLDGARGSVLGMIAGALRNARIPTPLPAGSQDKQDAVDAADAEAIALLKRLKRDLMHVRRFSFADTLDAYRRACTEAEGDIDEFLAAMQAQGERG